MRVKIWDDELQTEIATCELSEAIERDSLPEEYDAAQAELTKVGRYWIGGGASPLFLLTVVKGEA